MPFPLDLWIIHPISGACVAFERRFAGLPSVRILQQRYEHLAPHDCFVTAGNAFGIMTAGIDAAVIEKHGHGLMERIQARILNDYLGDQPVGTCFIEPTGTVGFPFVAHAPTMRMPGDITGTDAVYRATWSALLAVYHHNAAYRRQAHDLGEITSVAFPAMGCGFGGMDFDEAARQMAAAYRFYINPPHRLDWDAAIDRHKAVVFDGGKRMVRS
ncbi:MAG: macro domain-containing protein [Bacteroidota bacterium]